MSQAAILLRNNEEQFFVQHPLVKSIQGVVITIDGKSRVQLTTYRDDEVEVFQPLSDEEKGEFSSDIEAAAAAIRVAAQPENGSFAAIPPSAVILSDFLEYLVKYQISLEAQK